MASQNCGLTMAPGTTGTLSVFQIEHRKSQIEIGFYASERSILPPMALSLHSIFS